MVLHSTGCGRVGHRRTPVNRKAPTSIGGGLPAFQHLIHLIVTFRKTAPAPRAIGMQFLCAVACPATPRSARRPPVLVTVVGAQFRRRYRRSRPDAAARSRRGRSRTVRAVAGRGGASARRQALRDCAARSAAGGRRLCPCGIQPRSDRARLRRRARHRGRRSDHCAGLRDDAAAFWGTYLSSRSRTARDTGCSRSTLRPGPPARAGRRRPPMRAHSCIRIRREIRPYSSSPWDRTAYSPTA